MVVVAEQVERVRSVREAAEEKLLNAKAAVGAPLMQLICLRIISQIYT